MGVNEGIMNVVINGVSYAYEAGKTVFQFIQSTGIDVPSLCAASHQQQKQPCGLCVVDIDGVGIVRSCEQ